MISWTSFLSFDFRCSTSLWP